MKNHLKSNYHIFGETDSNSQSYISCRTIKYSCNNTNLILFKVFVLEKKKSIILHMHVKRSVTKQLIKRFERDKKDALKFSLISIKSCTVFVKCEMKMISINYQSIIQIRWTCLRKIEGNYRTITVHRRGRCQLSG